jgi:ubiquinone biosynthesis protein
VRLLQPSKLIPSAHRKWRVVIDALLEEFLRRFDRATLSRLLEHQRALPACASPGARAALLASELAALHKVCQMLARNPALPADTREALSPLERLPPASVPDENLAAALALAARVRPDFRPEPAGAKVARGSVADVFRFRDGTPEAGAVALKFVRPDAMPRIRREARILNQMSGDAAMISAFAGRGFARAIAEALRDASRALQREIDFAGEAENLREARAFYGINQHVRIPSVQRPALEQGLFMEFIEGLPILDIPPGDARRRGAARLVFRSIILEPLFSGLPEPIFHADPHAGNILVQMQKSGDVIVLLDWSQAGRLAAPRRHALLELCLHCASGSPPPSGLLERLLDATIPTVRIAFPRGGGDPLRITLDIVRQLAEGGHPVPLDLLLFRKSLLTVEGVVRQLDPGFDPWRETLIYACWVLASEAATRVWGIAFPWLDQPAFLRSGLPSRMLAAHAAGALGNLFVQTHNLC